MATDKIVAEYTVKVDQALKNLDALANRVSKIDQERKKTEEGFKQMSSNLVSDLSKVGAAIGVAFGVQQLVSFTKETVNLAAQAEGVERAFKRIGGGQYLQGLRDATRGTVTDLVLMQNAVKASNFKIPLENLASLFKFAQARARETGESVDYLVDSIILGIGRKSPLILDNLGISAVELRSRLKGVGVETANVGQIAQIIGDIATEEMAKMGDQADTTADKIAQIGTSFENMKVDIGKSLILLVEDVSKAWDALVDINAVRAKEASDALTESFKEGQSNAQKTIKNIEGIMKADEGRMKMIQQNLKFNEDAYDTEQKKVGELQKALDLANIEYGISALKKQKQLKAEIQASDELSESYLAQIDVFQSYINVATAKADTVEKEIRNVAYYQAAIKDVVDAIQAEGTAVKDIMPLREKEKQLRAELAKLLGEETEAQKTLKKQAEETAKRQYDDAVKWKELQDQINADLKAIRDATQDRYLNDIDNKFKRDELYSLQTISEAEGLSEALLQIEMDRITAQIEARKRLGLSTLDLEIQLAEIQSGIQTGQDEAYKKSIEYQIELQKELAQVEAERQQENLDFINTTLSAWQSVTSTVASLVEAQYQRQYNALDNALKNEEITREQYDKKRAQIARKQAKQQKEFAIVQAIINTALGVTNAFATAPNIILGAILAAVVAAAGAAEIATISSQPLPQFAEGGWVDNKGKIHGRSHGQGGVMIEAEGNEFITRGKYAKPNADILEAINTGNWEKYKFDNIIAPAIDKVMEGGLEGMGASYMLHNQFNDRNLLRVLDRNRQAEKEGFVYLGNRMEKVLRSNSRDRYA